MNSNTFFSKFSLKFVSKHFRKLIPGRKICKTIRCVVFETQCSSDCSGSGQFCRAKWRQQPLKDNVLWSQTLSEKCQLTI